MRTVHCSFCSRQVPVSKGGNVQPHRVGKQRCIGSGFNADQMARHADTLRDNMPGSQLADKFKPRS